MSSIGSFGTFTTARLAIYVSQKGLSVTGNNIANINTKGYTRQRLDQVSFKTGAADRYQSAYDMRVGNGAIAKSVSQLRDPYLDVRYRAEHSSEGFYNGKLNGLDDIADILDEIGRGENDGDGLLYAQFSDFLKALQHIQVGAGTQVNDTLASTSAESLCQLFYNAASQLERLHNNTEVQLRQEINDINTTLISIRKLNEAIQQAEIYGDGALELRDERNNLIDDLSEKLKINATYSMVDIGGKQVEKLTIRLGNANPDKDVESDSSILVDGNYCAQLTAPKANDAYNALYDKTSNAYQAALEGFKQNPPVGVTDADGNPITTEEALNQAIEDAAKDPAKQMLQFRYLDENGEGTNDPRKAAQVFDDDYNITVSDLRDKNDKAWEDYPAVKDVFVKDPDVKRFPTKAVYTGSFQITGGDWKDGDKVTVKVGTNEYTVEIGKDVTADAANEDPKNLSNAIRAALLQNADLKDNYDISTRTIRQTMADNTQGFNVQLTMKAKVPEEKAADKMPDISITADAQKLTPGSFTIGAVSQSTNKDGNIAGQFQAEVTVGNDKFNKGDTITVGTAKLVVGKDLSVKQANDPKLLATVLAGRMKLDGFTVSSTTDKDGKAYLVFKGGKDATAPTLPQTNVEAADPASLGAFQGKWVNGKPKDPNLNLTPDPVTVDNGDNTTSVLTTRYYLDDNDKWHETVRTVVTSHTKMLDDNDLFGKLQAVRELLTEEGEFSSQADINRDESASTKRGIPYYQEALDLLARQFATTMNNANNGFAVDENGNYLTSADGGKTFTELMVDGKPISKTGMTEDQQKAVEADALGNYIKANWAGFVKDADGKDTNVLADQYGNALKLGGTELTTENVKIAAGTLSNLNFASVKDGKLFDKDGNEIKITDPDKLSFTDDAFGTVPTPADPANPTTEETEAIKKAQEEIDAKKAAAETDLNKQALDSYLAVNGGYKMGGNLFSNRGDTDDASNITALNISVSKSWEKGDVHVVPTYIKLFKGETSNTTQQDNALHMGSLMEKDLVYNPQDLMDDALSGYLFEGSFQEMLVKMCTTLGNDQELTNVSLMTHVGQALDIDTSRDSVSAVDLNDEAMNLMQYTHSLNAAYRLMTTIDEMLERLITGTGVTR